ncbi:hypothetical protein ABE10_00705, partial [Bacillus toyonensis]|nr:hypothetical protein [Bacillus toyonensis]
AWRSRSARDPVPERGGPKRSNAVVHPRLRRPLRDPQLPGQLGGAPFGEEGVDDRLALSVAEGAEQVADQDSRVHLLDVVG